MATDAKEGALEVLRQKKTVSFCVKKESDTVPLNSRHLMAQGGKNGKFLKEFLKGKKEEFRYFAETHNHVLILATVNIEIFAQYIFSRISRRALDARKYDVSEKMKHYRSNRN